MSDDIQFLYAVQSGRHDEVARCISRGGAATGPAWRYDYGYSALHLAADRGHVRVAEVLLDRGWDLGARNDAGKRPLHHSTEDAYLQMIHFLVRRRAMVDCQDNFNYTPLHYAAVEGHATAARLLLSLGADRTIKEMNGETAKDIAKDENRIRQGPNKQHAVNTSDISLTAIYSYSLLSATK